MERKHHQKRRRRVTTSWLRKIGVPTALIAGVVFAATVGIKNLHTLGPDYLKNTRVFARSGIVEEVVDGDTFRLRNGLDYRLIGIDAPGRGQTGSKEAEMLLTRLVQGQRVWLEYDRYQATNSGESWLGFGLGARKLRDFSRLITCI